MTRSPVELRADLEFTRAGDEGIIYDEAQGLVHVLNRMGALVWESLRCGILPEEVAQRFAADHGVPVERVRGDVTRLLNDFESLGLMAGMSENRASE